jgi:large subunit ribosomal protein L7/L12
MSTDPSWRSQVAELLRQNRKIEAIKVYREASGCDLGTATTFVEQLQRTLASGDLPPAMPVSADDAALLDLLRQGQKIEAIKRYRERTGLGLKESKDAVEALAASAGLSASRGCLGAAAVLIAVAAGAVVSVIG